MTKPFIHGINIDYNENDIEIELFTSEGKKRIDLKQTEYGCSIFCSIAGGISQNEDGIFLTKNGTKTEKI